MVTVGSVVPPSTVVCSSFFSLLVTHRLARQKAALCHIHHCSETYHLRVILNEWNLVAQQARRTRDYFDRLERGEDNQYGNGFLSESTSLPVNLE